jgi:hypothetical protein
MNVQIINLIFLLIVLDSIPKIYLNYQVVNSPTPANCLTRHNYRYCKGFLVTNLMLKFQLHSMHNLTQASLRGSSYREVSEVNAAFNERYTLNSTLQERHNRFDSS